MGIKHFFVWYRKNFPDCIQTLNKQKPFEESGVEIDNLALDLNGLFHNSAQKIYEYGNCKRPVSYLGRKRPKKNGIKTQMKLFKEICEKIEYYRDMVKPKKRLILCIDGVAGAGKMSQQRQRRFRSSLENNSDCDFNSNCISPGTQFMDYLTKYIDWYIRIMISYFPDWQNIEIIFSNEKAEGEGEHKILNFIRKHDNNTESYCIQGLDADLIMLSMGTHIENIYILRENMYNISEHFLLNVGKFRENLVSHLKWGGQEVRFNKKTAIDDFIFMCFLVGNDFLPNIPSLAILENGIEIMLETYKNVGSTYGHLTRINKNDEVILRIKTLEPFMGTLSQYEKGLLEEKLNKSENFIKDELLEKHSYIKDEEICLNFDDYRQEYYEKKFEDSEKIKHVCHRYIEGMQWVITYYKKGMVDWEWFYKYHYAPFSIDLAMNCRTFKTFKLKNNNSIPPFQQLLSILPPKDSNLLPQSLGKLLTTSLSQYCPEKFEIDVSGKRREWEGIVLIPIPDFEEFKSEYDKAIVSVNESDNRRNIKGKSFQYVYDPEYSYYFKSFYGDIGECRVNNRIFDM